MARLSRLAVSGGLHHVGLQARDKSVLFIDDVDRTAFLTHFLDAIRQQGVAIHAYAMLDTEVRWLATPERSEALGRVMQSIGRSYVAAFNRRHGTRGGLWDGRFRSSVLEPGVALLPATLLIERLPVERGLVAEAADWPWSSAAHHLGRTRSALVSEHPDYWSIGNTPFDRELAHANLLAESLAPPLRGALEQALARGHAVGSPAFVEDLAAHVGRAVASRPRGRPRRA